MRGGKAFTPPRLNRGLGDLADHRSLCRASRRARLLCLRLSAGELQHRRLVRPDPGPGRNRGRLRQGGAARTFELSPECIGDIVVVPVKDKVIGSITSQHEFSGLNEPRRSHGGIAELVIPLIVNRKLSAYDGAGLWKFDAFFIACNHLARTRAAAE